MLRPIPQEIVYKGTISGLRISSVDGTAFLDNCAVEVPEANWKLETSGNISAGDNKLDYTSDNAFVEFGVDISAYQTGRHAIKVTDAAGKVAKGYISSTAPGGETLGAELITNGTFDADTDWSKDAGVTIEDGVLRLTNVGNNKGAWQSGASSQLGKVLYYTIDLANISGAHVRGILYSTNFPLPVLSVWSTNGTKTGYITCGSIYTEIVIANYSASGSVDIDNFSAKALTDCAATGSLIVSTLGGATRSWSSMDTGFDPNTACTYEIYDATLTGLADGTNEITIYDSAGAFLRAVLKAQGSGETLGANAVLNPGFESVTGDDFYGWHKYSSNGSINDETGSVNSGSHAVKVTQGSNKNTEMVYLSSIISQYALVYYEFYTRGNGGVAGRYNIGSLGISLTDTGVTGDVYTKVSGYRTSSAAAGPSIYLKPGGSEGNIAYFDDVAYQQVLTPSTDGVTLQASKWDATENFGYKNSAFTYNASSYFVQVRKVRG